MIIFALQYNSQAYRRFLLIMFFALTSGIMVRLTTSVALKLSPMVSFKNIPQTLPHSLVFSLEGGMLTDLLPLSSTFLLNEFLISLMTAEE